MSGHVRKLSSGKWIARFPLGERGKFRSKSFDRKVDAEWWVSRKNTLADDPRWVDPHGGKLRFGELATDWMDRRGHLARSTVSRDQSYLDSLILPTFGEMPVGRITVDDIERWVMQSEKAPATVLEAHQILSAILERAVRERLIERNPAELTENLPKVDSDEMLFLTRAQVGTLAEGCNGYRPLVWMAAYTGMRWAELIGLQHDAINRQPGSLTITRTIVEVNGHLYPKCSDSEGC